MRSWPPSRLFFLNFVYAFCAFAVIFLGGSLSAEPRFRADDGNIWHLGDNPALPASTNAVSLAAAVSAASGDWNQGPRDFAFYSPLFSLGYHDAPSGAVTSYGASLGLWDSMDIGYRADVGSSTTHNLGLLWRPFDFVSSALTLDDVSNSRVWGAGFALRPLDLFRPRSDWLSFTGDFAWGSAPEQRWGAKIGMDGTDVRAWYDVEAKAPGFELTLTWGPTETSARYDRVGEALKFSPSTKTISPVVLRLRIPSLSSAPLPSSPFVPDTPSLPGLVDLLDQAANDPQVVAVSFEDPPSGGGLAGDQELAAAIRRLHAAGKKVYVQASGYYDGQAFQGWIASADRVALDPTGVLILTSGASKRLYFKDFFDKIGVRFVNLAPWETKSANNPLTFSAMPDGERAMLNRFLTDRDTIAAAALADARGSRLKRPAKDLVADGPYLSSQEALDAGLVDQLENRAGFEAFIKTTYPQAMVVDHLPDPEPAWGPSPTRIVAVVHLAGDILPGAGEAGVSIGRDAAEIMAKLRENPSVKAVLLRVDSPGGAVQPSDELADQVKKMVAAGKPVAVSMGNVAASGGYYISAPATRIFAEPGTVTGSIGVTAVLFTAPKTLDMLGIKSDGVELGPSADFFDWTKAPTDAMLKKWGSMIDSTYQRFLDVVSQGRHIDKDKLEPLARGQVYTGHEALALGLVDEMGGLADARRWLEKRLNGSVQFVDFVPGESSLLGRIIAPMATAAIQASNSPTLKLAQTLDQLSAPWAEAVTGVAARGGGPLVWCDLP
jgi:protease-4